MSTTVKRRWGSPNAKRRNRRAVHLRLAKLAGIAERTAKDRFVGYLTPSERLAGQISIQLAACQDEHRYDMGLETLMPLFRLTLEPIPDWETAKHQHDHADARKRVGQVDFTHLARTGRATRRHWVAYRKQVMHRVVSALRLIAAGDLEYA